MKKKVKDRKVLKTEGDFLYRFFSRRRKTKEKKRKK
jgi:hypothetical protein